MVLELLNDSSSQQFPELLVCSFPYFDSSAYSIINRRVNLKMIVSDSQKIPKWNVVCFSVRNVGYCVEVSVSESDPSSE